jgi:hypothetical protein
MYHRAGYTGRVHRSAPSRRTPRAVRKALCECARGRGWLRAAPKKALIVQYLGFNPSRAAPPGAGVPPKYHTRPGHGAVRRAGLECRCATRGRLGENIWQTYGPARLPPPRHCRRGVYSTFSPPARRVAARRCYQSHTSGHCAPRCSAAPWYKARQPLPAPTLRCVIRPLAAAWAPTRIERERAACGMRGGALARPRQA